ncbi:hypothetical protein E2C01_053149 [Portunus trituberculatus]|uniref:Uncharacterized protein n=1 Tax=Portunus trituberculatus TaxID=210409 RepID=A0A5B7GR87_PORTR|nr:hypothetical protein [Portunus trituberculatus]
MVYRWRLCRAELRARVGRVTREAASSGEQAKSESIVYSVAAPKVCRRLRQTRYNTRLRYRKRAQAWSPAHQIYIVRPTCRPAPHP